MRPHHAELPVLVGVDGSRSAIGAVGVAAAEALRRRCRLRVLNAVHDTGPASEDEGWPVLRDGAAAARAGLTDAELEPLLVAGDPTRALCQHADKAGGRVHYLVIVDATVLDAAG